MNINTDTEISAVTGFRRRNRTRTEKCVQRRLNLDDVNSRSENKERLTSWIDGNKNMVPRLLNILLDLLKVIASKIKERINNKDRRSIRWVKNCKETVIYSDKCSYRWRNNKG